MDNMFFAYAPAIGNSDLVSLFPAATGILALFAAFALLFLIIGLAIYVYTSWAWMTIARKTKTHPTWLSWIPIANLYQRSQIARMHWWPILLIVAGILPTIGGIASLALFAFMIVWTWKSFERVKRPGWWALLIIIPVVGWIAYLILLGITAWGKP